MISVIQIFTSINVIIEINNDISTSKKNQLLISTIYFEWQSMLKFH